MLVIEQYGIQLKRLTQNDIELVRTWRNHKDIRKYMGYKKYITKSMQDIWFESVDNKYNYYFLIEYHEKSIGIINAKKINLKSASGEGGIFIWDNNLENEFIPVFASLCLLNTAFFVFKLFNKSFVQILRDNPKAIQFNKALGYILVPGQEKVKNPYYILTKEDYEKKVMKLRLFAEKYSSDFALPRISGIKSENNLAEINTILV